MSGVRTLEIWNYDKDKTEVYRVIVKLNHYLTQGELLIGERLGIDEFDMHPIKTMIFDPPLDEYAWMYLSYKFAKEIEEAILIIKRSQS